MTKSVEGSFASESGFSVGIPLTLTIEDKIKETLLLTPEQRIEKMFNLFSNIAMISQQIWPNADLKQEALDSLVLLAKEGQCLC